MLLFQMLRRKFTRELEFSSDKKSTANQEDALGQRAPAPLAKLAGEELLERVV